MSAAKFNLRNPAVKRIMQEIKEMQSEKSADFIADALEDDIFEWHFVVRGPPDTEFEGGIYHGRILLPAEYPFKPPSFMMLTPNGRFQTGVKICLSISSHHPEHWQPSWSVRTALTAMVAFMPTPGQGALGSLDFTKDERKQLAAKSCTEVPKFGSAARQKVINDMHQLMLELQQQAAAKNSSSSSSPSRAKETAPAGPAAPAAVVLGRSASIDAAPTGLGSSDQDSQKRLQPQQQSLQQLQLQPRSQQVSTTGESKQFQQQQQAESASLQDTLGQNLTITTSSSSSSLQDYPKRPAAAVSPQQQPSVISSQLQLQPSAMVAAGSRPGDLGDRGLTFLAVVLSVVIAAMLLKKVMSAMGGYRLLMEM